MYGIDRVFGSVPDCLPPAVPHAWSIQGIPGAKVILPQVVSLDSLNGIAIVAVAQDIAIGVGEVDGAIRRIDWQRPAQNPRVEWSFSPSLVQRAEVLQVSGLQVITQEITGRPE